MSKSVSVAITVGVGATVGFGTTAYFRDNAKAVFGNDEKTTDNYSYRNIRRWM